MSAANNFNLESRNWIGNFTMTGTFSAGNISGNQTLTVGSVVFLSGINVKETAFTGLSYTALATDFIIAPSWASGVTGTVTLPSGVANGTYFIIKDNSGTATLNTFLISGQPNIDGTGNYRITDDYGSISVYKGSQGWRII